MSLKVWLPGEKIDAADLNNNFASMASILPIALPYDAYSTRVGFGGYLGNDSPDEIYYAVMPMYSPVYIYKLSKISEGFYLSDGDSTNVANTNEAGENNFNFIGITATENYVYVAFSTNQSGGSYKNELVRLDVGTLANQTPITGGFVGTENNPFGERAAFVWDPAVNKFWLLYNSTTLRGYTISGTTLTQTNNITLNTTITNYYQLGGLYRKANGNFIIIAYHNSTKQVIYEFNSSGVLQSTRYATFYGKGNVSGIVTVSGRRIVKVNNYSSSGGSYSEAELIPCPF